MKAATKHKRTAVGPEADAVGPKLVTDGARKVVFCTREQAGADAYAWLIRTDGGKWISEPGFSFPAALRAHGLRSKEAAITPAEAAQHDSEQDAAEAACRAGLEWLSRVAHDVTGPASEAVQRVFAALSRWEVGPLPPASLVETLIEKPAEEAAIAEKVASRTRKKARAENAVGSSAQAVEPLGQAQGRTAPQAQGRKRKIVDVALGNLHRHPANRSVSKASCKALAADLQRRGLLQPIHVREPGTHWNLPDGHYQIVFGERRFVAAQVAGWATIPCEIVELDDQATQDAITAENGQREQLNDVERAQRLAWSMKPTAEGGGGMTQTAAAASMGIDQSTASSLMGLLKLGKDWQGEVIAGAMTGSQLRPLLKYADCPRLLDLIWVDYQRCRTSTFTEEIGAWATRDTIADTVRLLIEDQTSALTKADLLPEEYSVYCPKFTVRDDATLKKLDVIEVPTDKGTVRRCANKKLWRELQEGAGRGGKACAGGSSAQAVEPLGQAQGRKSKKEPTPAEVRAAEAEADRELVHRITRPGGIAEQGLRWAMAETIRESLAHGGGGTEAVALVAQTVTDAAREREGSSELDIRRWRYLAWRLVRADRPPAKGKPMKPPPALNGYASHEAHARYTRDALANVEDYVTTVLRHQAYFASLVLFPADDRITDHKLAMKNAWPDRWPAIDHDLLVLMARDLKASLLDTWAVAQRGLPRRWLELLIATHNQRRQRLALAEELGVATFAKDGMSEIGDAIVKAHAGVALPLPRVLKNWKANSCKRRKNKP